jgi:hypothetical protein
VSTTLNQLVRDQILAEGPDIASLKEYISQRAYVDACENYIDVELNAMNNVELLRYISDALAHGVRTQWLYDRSYSK